MGLAKTVFRSFAWTNVFKIAPTRGNPPRKLRKLQVNDNTLRDEIEYLRPDVILFFTGPKYDSILEKMLPISCISSTAVAQIAGLEEAGFGGVALRTYHPQYSRFDMKEVVARIQAETT